ncbi:MAG: hypothetical protein IT440_06430 [Phycisphaeraceae bacterium]|nr:hypothetical protein [Phycisphaeraceae bacterium]
MAHASPEHLLDRTLSARRATTVATPGGTPARQWQTHIAKLPGRVRPRGTRAVGDRHLRLFTVYVDAGCDIVSGDRVVDGSIVMNVLAAQPMDKPASMLALMTEEVIA